jgi:hypothetical protein
MSLANCLAVADAAPAALAGSRVHTYACPRREVPVDNKTTRCSKTGVNEPTSMTPSMGARSMTLTSPTHPHTHTPGPHYPAPIHLSRERSHSILLHRIGYAVQSQQQGSQQYSKTTKTGMNELPLCSLALRGGQARKHEATRIGQIEQSTRISMPSDTHPTGCST